MWQKVRSLDLFYCVSRPSQDPNAPCPQNPFCQAGWRTDQPCHPFSCKPIHTHTHTHTQTPSKTTNCASDLETLEDNINVSQGKPKPVVSWLKDSQPIDTKRVNIRNSDKDSILFIRSSQRDDSGVYEMTVKVDSLEDKATITLQIVGETQLSLFTLSQACKRGT